MNLSFFRVFRRWVVSCVTVISTAHTRIVDRRPSSGNYQQSSAYCIERIRFKSWNVWLFIEILSKANSSKLVNQLLRIVIFLICCSVVGARQQGQVCCLFNHWVQHVSQHMCPHRAAQGSSATLLHTAHTYFFFLSPPTPTVPTPFTTPAPTLLALLALMLASSPEMSFLATTAGCKAACSIMRALLEGWEAWSGPTWSTCEKLSE